MISTSSNWFGITYTEEKTAVESQINALVNAGEYPKKLVFSNV
jgi:hypothetical protein